VSPRKWRSSDVTAILYNAPVSLTGAIYFWSASWGRQIDACAVARRLAKRFIDADHELERRLGVTIPTIFEIEGETGFRDREEVVIHDLAQMTDIVLATGGGAVLRAASRAQLKENGTVIYLFAEPQTLWDRVCRLDPQLQAPDPRARLFQLFAERDPLYREVADHVVPSERDAVLRFVRSLEPGEQTSSAS
jgi:shikimate kinase